MLSSRWVPCSAFPSPKLIDCSILSLLRVDNLQQLNSLLANSMPQRNNYVKREKYRCRITFFLSKMGDKLGFFSLFSAQIPELEFHPYWYLQISFAKVKYRHYMTQASQSNLFRVSKLLLNTNLLTSTKIFLNNCWPSKSKIYKLEGFNTAS